jgi:hypothetical protein
MTPAEHGQERAYWMCPNGHGAVRPHYGCAFCGALSEEFVPADRERALVEAGNNVISDLERQGSVTSAHYNALRAALDRIQPPETPPDPG